MPKQLTLFGRPIPRFTARRLTFLLLSLSLIAISCILFLTSGIPSTPSLSQYDHKITIPHIPESIAKSRLNPFRQPSHAPPRQKNDSFRGSKWWADWKWLSVPFSSSVTLDEDRALLPPMQKRPPIYCYYDATIKKTRAEKDAESDLLLTWRRAWWAQGFRPVILSAAEAINNPTYDALQRIQVDADVKTELMRWLAWSTMEGGLLAHYTLLPMAPQDAPLLVYLRRGEYPALASWQDLGTSLYAGQKADVDKAISSLMDPSVLSEANTVESLLREDLFSVEKPPTSLAHYDAAVIEKKYSKVAEGFTKSRAQGLQSLNSLINTHLHITWQNNFPEGIEVLKPLPLHSTTMISGAFKLAHSLAACSESPMPGSCPPNKPKCTPCVSRTPMNIITPSRYHNSTHLFTIGTVPHPWTVALVTNLREDFDISWIRRDSPRDPWLASVTQSLLGTGVSGNLRIMRFKEAVAGEYATAYSLWRTAERDIPAGIDWYFGFAIPKHPLDDGKARSPVPADYLVKGKEKNPDKGNGPVPTEEDLLREPALLQRAKEMLTLAKPGPELTLRGSLEAWNLADTEAWKFVGAFQARKALEREKWEKDEAKYSGGAGTESGRDAWSRWLDRSDDKTT